MCVEYEEQEESDENMFDYQDSINNYTLDGKDTKMLQDNEDDDVDDEDSNGFNLFFHFFFWIK